MLLFVTELTNLALNKSAYQTDTYKSGKPGLAVDGNTAQIYSESSCTHTLSTDATWEVDLGEMAVVEYVVIYGRVDCCRKTFYSFIDSVFVCPRGIC